MAFMQYLSFQLFVHNIFCYFYMKLLDEYHFSKILYFEIEILLIFNSIKFSLITIVFIIFYDVIIKLN